MPKRILKGLVRTVKDKTLSVIVERLLSHPLYGKSVKQTKKYSVHTTSNAYKVGDEVTIIESRPISKTKKWIVLEQNTQNS